MQNTHIHTHTHTHTHIHIHTQVTARPCTSTVFSSDGSITLPDVTHGCLTKKLRRLHIVSVPGKTDAKESAVVNAAECRSFSRMLQVYSGEERSFWPNNLAFGAPLIWRRHLPRWKYEESHNSCGLLHFRFERMCFSWGLSSLRRKNIITITRAVAMLKSELQCDKQEW